MLLNLLYKHLNQLKQKKNKLWKNVRLKHKRIKVFPIQSQDTIYV